MLQTLRYGSAIGGAHWDALSGALGESGGRLPDPSLTLRPLRGGEALATAWKDLLAGRTGAGSRLMLTPRG